MIITIILAVAVILLVIDNVRLRMTDNKGKEDTSNDSKAEERQKLAARYKPYPDLPPEGDKGASASDDLEDESDESDE
jgi:hypothetical protein